jgi:hypothetical protein
MRRFVRLHRSLSRLVILVMLAAALFPALGHAFASGKLADPGWMEVCTVGGVETRSAATGESGPSVPALLVEHCPYCLMSSFDDVFPKASASAVFPVRDADVLLFPLVSSVTSVPIWPAALPRAPPAAL